MDPAARQFVQGFRSDSSDIESDLSVDGLSESVLSRIFHFFTFGRS